MKNTLTILVEVLALALSGSILAGCDDGGNTDVVTSDSGNTEVVTSDSGSAGDPCSTENVIVVSSSPADALKLCVGWSALKAGAYVGAQPYASVAACVASLSATMSESQAQAECTTSMTAAECADWAHDFVDSAGVKHAFTVKDTAGSTTVLVAFVIWTEGCQTGVSDRPRCNGQ